MHLITGYTKDGEPELCAAMFLFQPPNCWGTKGKERSIAYMIPRCVWIPEVIPAVHPLSNSGTKAEAPLSLRRFQLVLQVR